MNQIKIFQADSTTELESAVNAWLAETKTDVQVTTITPSTEKDGALTRLIVFYFLRDQQKSMSFSG